MPARKNIDTFPPVFQKLTLFAISKFPETKPDSPPLIRIDAKSVGMGVNMMQQLRQYWAALALALKNGAFAEYDPRLPLARECHNLACRANKVDKKYVEVIHRCQLVTAQAISSALEEFEGQIDAAMAKTPQTGVGPHVAPAATLEIDGLLGEKYGAE